jgi:hypothetical protein
VGSNPTLSAIGFLHPSLSIVFRPTSGWRAVRAAQPRWLRSLLAQALPFSLLSLLTWPKAATVPLCLAGVLLLGLAFFALASWFEVRRSWDRSLAVAAYASTPVFLAWPLLVAPQLAVVAVVGLLHCFALCYLGVQLVLDCRESEAAMYVAAAWVVSAVGGMLLGGLCTAAGLL